MHHRAPKTLLALLALATLILIALPANAQPPPPDYFTETPVQYARWSFKIVKATKAPPAQDAQVIRYRVAVERGLETHAEAFTATVERVLGDKDGWERAGKPLRRVDEGEDITVLLGNPKTIDGLCKPMNTGGTLSCAIRRRANINVLRFTDGAWTWGEDVTGYRSYLINHEVGHLLGMGHYQCPKKGAPAPVMMQQTLRLSGCKPHGAPVSTEIKDVQRREKTRWERWTRLKRADARWNARREREAKRRAKP